MNAPVKLSPKYIGTYSHVFFAIKNTVGRNSAETMTQGNIEKPRDIPYMQETANTLCNWLMVSIYALLPLPATI